MHRLINYNDVKGIWAKEQNEQLVNYYYTVQFFKYDALRIDWESIIQKDRFQLSTESIKVSQVGEPFCASLDSQLEHTSELRLLLS